MLQHLRYVQARDQLDHLAVWIRHHVTVYRHQNLVCQDEHHLLAELYIHPNGLCTHLQENEQQGLMWNVCIITYSSHILMNIFIWGEKEMFSLVVLKSMRTFISNRIRKTIPMCNGVCRRLFLAFKSAPALLSSSNTMGSLPKAAWWTARSPSLS